MAINIGADISTIYIDDKAVDKVYVGDKLVYQRQSGEHYLTFSRAEAFYIAQPSPAWNGTIEYSTDAKNWSEWDGTRVNAEKSDDNIYYLYFRGTGNTIITGRNGSAWSFSTTGSAGISNGIYCSGNIETLLDYKTVVAGRHPVMLEYCFYRMFRSSKVFSAPELPATTLAPYCYAEMFNQCCLSVAPKLPATTLASACYKDMFSSNATLKEASELPATTLAVSCYQNMYAGCEALETIPVLPATELPYYAYNSMFSRCFKLKIATTQDDTYIKEYRIPASGEGTVQGSGKLHPLYQMFYAVSPFYTQSNEGTPSINRTYYTSNEIV